MANERGPDRAETGPMLSPGFWLHHAALTWRAELDARLRPLGLTHTQFMLLASAGWLEYVDGPPTQQQVADHAGADRMMTSRVVRLLEERGLLARQAHERNANTLRLTLTPEGRTVIAEATRSARDVDALFFGAEPAPLRDALRRIAARGRLRERAEGAPATPRGPARSGPPASA